VLIGENNSGKTALLEALRIVLSRNSVGRGPLFDEYDYHMCKVGDGPQTCDGILIELWFREDKPNEWPDSLIQALTDIIQTDPIEDRDSIGLRLTSKFDALTEEEIPKWEFLAIDGQPLVGKGARQINFTLFFAYIRLFYLSASRDADEEFSPRSQFWGKILKDLKIKPDQMKSLSEELQKLNTELLAADPRLQQVVTSLGEVQTITGLGAKENVSIQALPIRPWDLMSKSQVVMKGHGTEIDFPLSRYGQGTQSLAVLFLFQAYLIVLLKPMFHPETEAILALEEPEAHLHPQVTRAFASTLEETKGQKIISSHSPYFIQEIPFEKIRLLRKTGPATQVFFVKRNFSVKIPESKELLEFCSNNMDKFKYHSGSSTLFLLGRMDEPEYRGMVSLYPGRPEIHAQLKKLRTDSAYYLSREELANLDTYAKRIRGEILFARAWLLCEGQCEYLLFRYFAELLGKPLDRAGVAVIDFQNNGSPSSFVGLARAFGIPWVMVCDNDPQGKEFVRQVNQRGLTSEESAELVRTLPGEGVVLEKFLVENGFVKEYEEIIRERGINLTSIETDTGYKDELVLHASRHKVEFTNELIKKMNTKSSVCTSVPPLFIETIKNVVEKASL
jgi:putative ATP-dependent endonuclease of OLD family